VLRLLQILVMRSSTAVELQIVWRVGEIAMLLHP
jgi:hypothetical protein